MTSVLILLDKPLIVVLKLSNGIKPEDLINNGDPSHVEMVCTNSDLAMNNPCSLLSRIKMLMMEAKSRFAMKRTHQCIGDSKDTTHD